MEYLNRSLFLLLNAGQNAPSALIALARAVAQYLIWIVPAGLIAAWLRGSNRTRQALLAAAIAGLVGLLVSQAIGLAWYHPRPFAVGIGRTLLAHAADSSFPSDHVTLIWAVAISLMARQATRRAGWALAALGLPLAWARIYLGLHWPLDMLGAAFVALPSAWLIRRQERRLIAPAMPLLLSAYRRLCSGPIRSGWVRQ